MKNTNLKSTNELIENLINDIRDKNLDTYILKTRIDRILIRIRQLKEEGYIVGEVHEIYNKLELKYKSCGGYGGGGYISNLESIIEELNKINTALIRGDEI